MSGSIRQLQQEIIACRKCPRLVAYRELVALEKRRAYRDQAYWGRPVPSFGDPAARLLIVGLAPGAHGANRTGRMFTGDSSGDLLYRVIHRTGFSSQPESRSKDDGLVLRDVYISAPVHCVPPQNKPTTKEIATCADYLAREIEMLPHVRVVIALGRTAFDAYLRILRARGDLPRPFRPPFGHGTEANLEPLDLTLLASYHPSQQNTSTGKLTESMFHAVFERARILIDESS